MKRFAMRFLPLTILLSTLQLFLCGISYCECGNAASTIHLSGTSIESVIRKACMVYQCGFDNRPEVSMETVGISILGLDQDDTLSVAYVQTAHHTFGISNGELQKIGSSQNTVKVALEHMGQSEYRIVSYFQREDGVDYNSSIERIFPASIAQHILSSSIENDIAHAEADALRIGNAYFDYCQGAEDTGEWIELLPVGSNPDAPAALNSLYCRLPTSPGIFIWEGYNIVFSLSVEGEQSLSGILTYTIVDQDNSQEYHFTVQTNGDSLVVLDGSPPQPFTII